MPATAVDTASKHIMWTSTCHDQTPEYWVPRHFVPMLSLHPASEEPSVVEEDGDHPQHCFQLWKV